MLRIEREATTQLYVTVTELTTISSVEYIFEFEHEQTSEKVAAILTDTSTATTRYNKFAIQDTVDLTFPYTGDYIYRVYEQAAGTGTKTTTGLTMVEKGLAYVYEPDETKNEYTNPSESNTVYERE